MNSPTLAVTVYPSFTRYDLFCTSPVILIFPNFPPSGVSSNEITQSNGATIAGFFGALTSKSCFTLSIPDASAAPATPPSWKVSSVS